MKCVGDDLRERSGIRSVRPKLRSRDRERGQNRELYRGPDPDRHRQALANAPTKRDTEMKRICVFCGSHLGNGPSYAHMARDIAERLVRAGYGIVYGGGSIGLMGVVADAALAAGGEVVGVIPQALARMEVAHPNLSDLHVVTTMHERKALMAELSDGFIALPGGFGTMDEFCEVLTWQQLRNSR